MAGSLIKGSVNSFERQKSARFQCWLARRWQKIRRERGESTTVATTCGLPWIALIKTLRRLRFFFRVGVPELPESLPFRKETPDISSYPPTIALIDKRRDPVARGYHRHLYLHGCTPSAPDDNEWNGHFDAERRGHEPIRERDKTVSGPSWKIVEHLCKIQNLQNKKF